MMDKIQQRNKLLKKRAKHTAQYQQEKSIQIVHHIKQSSLYKNAKRIAFYHAVRGEADPESLSLDDTKQFFLPVVSNNEEQGLSFAQITFETQYKNNKFAIPEPIFHPDELASAESLDLVLMPLLGFDIQGNRLGMGGGFYDRSFSFKKLKPEKPILIGFAFDFQEIEEIQTEPWDIGLDVIATESRFILLEK